MLLAILGLYVAHGRATGVYTFDYNALLGTTLSPAGAMWLMLGFFMAFAVKLSVFPLHTWLPDAHTEAPTAGSVDLAGLVLKVGAYGFVGKFYVLRAGVGSLTWGLPLALVISSAIGLYYYLRIIVTMFLEPEAASKPGQRLSSLPLSGSLILGLLFLLLAWFGIYPAPLLRLIEAAVAGLL